MTVVTTNGYPGHRQSMIEQAEEAEVAAVNRVERLAADVAELENALFEKKLELKNAESVLRVTEIRATEERKRGTHVQGFPR